MLPRRWDFALDASETSRGEGHSEVVRTLRANWERVVHFLEFHEEICGVICTSDAIESLNAVLRQAVSPRGHSWTDDAAMTLLYLTIANNEERCSDPREAGLLPCSTSRCIPRGDRQPDPALDQRRTYTGPRTLPR